MLISPRGPLDRLGAPIGGKQEFRRFLGLNRIVIGASDRFGLSATNKRECYQMSIRKAAMATLVAASMVGAPTVAYAAQASVGSTQVVRQGAPVEGESDLRGGSVIIAILAAAAVIAAIVIAAGGNNDNPASP